MDTYFELNKDILSDKIYDFIASPTDENLNKIKSFIKESGVDINAQDYSGNTRLLRVANESANYKIIKRENGSYSHEFEPTPISPSDKLKLMKTLIELGADVNIQNNSGQTALMFTKGHSEQTKLLLDNNANIYLTDTANRNSLDYLDPPQQKLVKCKDAINALNNGRVNPNARDKHDNRTLLMEYGDLAAPAFIKAGTDVNAQNNKGETALMLMKEPEMVKAVIEAGADINAKDKEGKSVLAHAFENNCSKEVIQTLLDHGADIYAQDKQGKLAYSYAKSNEAFSLVQPTIFNDNVKNIEKEQNPVVRVQKASNLVLSVKNKEQAQALVNLGVDPNARYAQNRTVVMATAYNDNIEATKAWIEVGADTKLQDSSGNNAMDYAKTAEMKSVLAAASIRQTNREKEAQTQTQTQTAPTRQTQVNMNVATKTQGGR